MIAFLHLLDVSIPDVIPVFAIPYGLLLAFKIYICLMPSALIEIDRMHKFWYSWIWYIMSRCN